jgi:bacillithiol biosynthesis cysteine-adding enzyme BshC
MQKTLINRTQTGLFTGISNELVYNQELFSELITAAFSTHEIRQQIERKKQNFPQEHRVILQETLRNQYKNFEISALTQNNIDLLSNENTFTITTGHQLNVFTGPLYFIYKILHVIRLCEALKNEFPTFNFVPVYWMASEDHDFEEIQSTQLFGKKITWNSAQKGAVGEFELENWTDFQTELKAFFANNPDSEVNRLIDKYTGENLSEATFQLVNELFKSYGLVIIEPNSHALKKLFIPVMERELLHREAEKAVLQTNEKLLALNFKPQVHARQINLFYLSKNSRERILWKNDTFEIPSLGSLTEEEIISKLRQNPDSFSPNVVLRPVYQETILPNLVYVGGGGEMAYWLQFKAVFDVHQITFPLLQVRTSIQFIDAGSEKKRTKLELEVEDLFKDLDVLKKEYTLKKSGDKLQFLKLHESFKDLNTLMLEYAKNVDSSLEGFAKAEISRFEKQIFAFEQRLIKHQKSAFDTAMKQLEDLKEKLFPNKGVQERVDSFFNFCASGNVSTFLHELKENIDPFEKDFVILTLQ